MNKESQNILQNLPETYAKKIDGVWQQVNTPRWKHDDGTDFTEEEYNEHGYHVIVNERPEGDFLLVEIVTNDNEHWDFKNGRVYVTYTVTPRDIDFVKRMAIGELNSRFDQHVYDIGADIPEQEVLTWNIQREEALAWQKDNEIKTPMIDGIAKARDIGPEALRLMVLAKAKEYTENISEAVGYRQKYRNLILEAPTPEEAVTVARESVFYDISLIEDFEEHNVMEITENE